MRETGILDKMAQREREGVRYVNVERKEETRTAANNGSASENNGQTETPRILRKLALRGRTGSKYYNPGQADGYTETNLQRYLDLTVEPLQRRSDALNAFYDDTMAQKYVPQEELRAANRSAANDMLYARTGATDASAWLYANANRLEDDAIDSLAREIAARRDSELALRNMSDSLGDYWGQFESEDAYEEALAQQAEYERLLNLQSGYAGAGEGDRAGGAPKPKRIGAAKCAGNFQLARLDDKRYGMDNESIPRKRTALPWCGIACGAL